MDTTIYILQDLSFLRTLDIAYLKTPLLFDVHFNNCIMSSIRPFRVFLDFHSNHSLNI